MKKRAPAGRVRKWITLLAIAVAALGFVFYCAAVPTIAQEQSPKKQQPESAPQPSGKGASEELTNESCIECHNPDILKMSKEELADNVEVADKPLTPRVKPPYIFGELNLAIHEKKYASGVHADAKCIECHKDVKNIPHPQRLKSVDCKECHEESVETIEASAHGIKSRPKEKVPGCIGCHDVHYGEGQTKYAADWKKRVCLDCHKAYGLDTLAQHKNLYEAGLHLTSLGCMMCHKGKKAGVHNMAPVKTKVAACESCHTKKTVLSKEKVEPKGFTEYVLQTRFINAEARKEFGYVIGAHRIPAADLVVILVVLGPLALPIFHGGLRFLTRRKGPIELPQEKILLHPLIERIWHWFQALCIVMLIITGIMLHWPEKFPGWFSWAVTVHNWFGIGALIAFLVWLVYNLATRRISHYIPKKGEIPMGLITQARFYGYGIFKHEPHPYAPTEDNKFNPLQKIAYLQFQVMLMPILLISGILYMYPETFKGVIDAIGGMTVLAIFHYLLGTIFAAFLVSHLYLATTGETIGENFKAIIFGYGIKQDHDTHHV